MKRIKKKTIGIMAVILIIAMTAGCAAPQDGTDRGRIDDDVDFEIINDDMLDDEIKDIIQQIKDEKGYSIIKEANGFYYIFIGMGEKPSGGYDIKVISVKDVDGKTKILIEETKPDKDDMVTDELTYPYIVIKINKDSFVDFVIEIDQKEKYEEIVLENGNGKYDVIDEYFIYGIITQAEFGKDHVSFLIESDGEKYVYDKAMLKADSKTIVHIDGESKDYTSIYKGMKASVVIHGPVAESYPVQAYAAYISDKKSGSYDESIDYEVVTDEEESLQYIKHHRGFGIIREDESFYYIFIGAGEKNTGGYDIFVESAYKEDDTIYITVKETSPGKDDIVIQVITYPYQIIRINKEHGRNIIVTDGSGEELEDINDETKEDKN